MALIPSSAMIWAAALLASAAASASSLKPPVLPLIVRNPYLSTWLANARDPPWEHWPMFWTGQQVGLSVMASVAQTKTIYPLLGRPHDSLPQTASFTVSLPTYEGASFDASTTNLSYRLGPDDSVKLTLSFLSPITPLSTLRQSVPAAYMAVYLEGSLDVAIYTDVNGEWVSGTRDSMIEWQLEEESSEVTDGEAPIKSWRVSRETQLQFTESVDRAEWGSLHFTAPSTVQYQSGVSAAVRLQFAQQGLLRDEVDNRFRSIKDSEPVFAFSASFNFSQWAGQGQRFEPAPSKASIVFTLALVQDPIVQFASARGLTHMRPLWASYFSGPAHMISCHYGDFHVASRLANDYSQRLQMDAETATETAGTQSYRDIVSLSARQVMGATQFSGTPDNPLIFLKEISSNGNFQTVDVIFPAFPFFLYTNPRWLAYLLEPLLEHQLSGQYPNDYSMHDIGAHFPNATGHADGKDEYMPVEECGNMLIMALAVVNSMKDDSHQAWTPSTVARGHFGHRRPDTTTRGDDFWPLEVDGSGMDRPVRVRGLTGEESARAWASRPYELWKQWTGYLVRESLIPRNQLSTDDFAGWLANQTNLALKGIIGIRAMADISELVGEHEDAQRYRAISQSYIDKWLGYGISRDGTHAKLAYTWYGSWTTLYNLFADSLLCFRTPGSSASLSTSGEAQKPLGTGVKGRFIPRRVYSMQSTWYRAVLQRYGLPLDSRHLYAKSDWEFFAAAVAGRKTWEAMVESIALWVNETVTDRPLTDLYDTEGQGGFSPATFMARPVVGGHFARLALKQACGGSAIQALEFLDKEADVDVDVAEALAADAMEMASDVHGGGTR